MNTLAQNTDTQVNQAECTNLSPESRKALERKGIFVRTCEELTRHVRAVVLGATVVAAQAPAPVSAQGSTSAPTEQTASLAQTAPSVETKQDLSAASRAFMESLVKNGDITPEVLEKVMTSDAFEYNPGKDEAPISREKLALPDANLPLHFAELLKVLGKDPVSSKKWEERIAEMSPNEDELQILRKVIAAMPEDKLQPTVIANTLIGIMTLHKFVQAPDDKYLLLNMYDDIHKVLYGLGWDVSSHVMVPVNDGELSYTFLLPTTAESIVFIGEKAGFDPNKLQAFHKALIPAQQEFIAKFLEVAPKASESLSNVQELGQVTELMIATELGRINFEKASKFREEYAKLSPQEQTEFMSTIHSETLLSSGAGLVHTAFNAMTQDQREAKDDVINSKVKKDSDLLQSISTVLSSQKTNKVMIIGGTPSRIEKRFSPIVASLGLSEYQPVQKAFDTEKQAVAKATMTQQEFEKSQNQEKEKVAKLEQEIAQADARIAQADARIAQSITNSAKILSTELVGTKID